MWHLLNNYSGHSRKWVWLEDELSLKINGEKIKRGGDFGFSESVCCFLRLEKNIYDPRVYK